MRLFWRILAVFAGLLLLLIAAVAIAIRAVDVNDFTAPIQQRVKDATGRELVIKGGIELKLSLEPKLMINDVALGNASWGKSPQMLSARRIEAEVALLPLLQRRFEITHLTLVEPMISLETDARGKGNWEMNTVAPAESGAQPNRAANAFAIGDVSVKEGALTYRDGETGKTTSVVIENLSLHARDPQSPVSARFRGKVDDLAIALEGDLGPLDALTQRRWPYPVSLKGEIDGKSATIATKVRAERQTVTLDELQLGLGQSSMSGQVAIAATVPRRTVTIRIDAQRLALGDLPIMKASRSAAGAARDLHVFPDIPIDFEPLRGSDADGDISIRELVLEGGRRLDDVRVQFTLREGRLGAPILQASVFGGSVHGKVDADVSRGHAPSMTLHIEAKGLDAATLLAAAGAKRDIRGGRTDLKLDLTLRGASPREWASSASGSAIAFVGPATLSNTRLERDSPLMRLAEAVNPFIKVDPSTELHCAVARLPLKNGVAQIDRSIALESAKYAASASGTIDLRNETLDLSIKPRVREGVVIKVPQIAELVRFRGPIRSPAVTIDAVGAATNAARIGAAVYTGGLSILGESLLASTATADGSPCQIALGHAIAPAAGAAAEPSTHKPAVPLVGDIGKALGRVIGR